MTKYFSTSWVTNDLPVHVTSARVQRAPTTADNNRYFPFTSDCPEKQNKATNIDAAATTKDTAARNVSQKKTTAVTKVTNARSNRILSQQASHHLCIHSQRELPDQHSAQSAFTNATFLTCGGQGAAKSAITRNCLSAARQRYKIHKTKSPQNHRTSGILRFNSLTARQKPCRVKQLGTTTLQRELNPVHGKRKECLPNLEIAVDSRHLHTQLIIYLLGSLRYRLGICCLLFSASLALVQRLPIAATARTAVTWLSPFPTTCPSHASSTSCTHVGKRSKPCRP